VARVEVARAAVEDLDRLAATLSLPADTRERVRRSLSPLVEFPRIGVELTERWQGLRFVVGPWRWMLLVYEYREADDRVVVLTIQDARSSSAATPR
jgi:plasmid stabilization system protein ParE